MTQRTRGLPCLPGRATGAQTSGAPARVASMLRRMSFQLSTSASRYSRFTAAGHAPPSAGSLRERRAAARRSARSARSRIAFCVKATRRYPSRSPSCRARAVARLIARRVRVSGASGRGRGCAGEGWGQGGVGDGVEAAPL